MSDPSERSGEQVEVLSQATNAAIVRMPGRRFPGVVVQGDTLSILVDSAEELVSGLSSHPDEELRGAAEELHSKLSGLLVHYEKTLERAGIELPYVRSTAPRPMWRERKSEE